jgi:uncharacterized protein (TIGR03435 family)
VSALRLAAIDSIVMFALGFSSFTPSILSGQAISDHSKSDQQQKEEVPAPLPTFAVATVKPAQNSNGMSFLRDLPDGIRIENLSVQEILRMAFRMQDDRVFGVPDWANVERFDVEAKVDDSDVAEFEKLTLGQQSEMLVPLLVDRFGLKFHHEQRELPTYSLVIAKGGSKLKESNAEFAQRHLRPLGRGQLESIGTPLKALVPILSRQLGRTVFDETGLTGLYDYTLQWTPDDRFGPFPNGSNGDAGSASKPDLFTALREQLGLDLKSQRGRVEVVVVDHISQPNAN